MAYSLFLKNSHSPPKHRVLQKQNAICALSLRTAWAISQGHQVVCKLGRCSEVKLISNQSSYLPCSHMCDCLCLIESPHLLKPRYGNESNYQTMLLNSFPSHPWTFLYGQSALTLTVLLIHKLIVTMALVPVDTIYCEQFLLNVQLAEAN